LKRGTGSFSLAAKTSFGQLGAGTPIAVPPLPVKINKE
jgi:hypothetical protein